MATQAHSTIIVSEVLGDDNYPEWKTCIEDYLLAQDLWDVVGGPDTEPPKQRKELKHWKKRNAAALHAIRLSCGPKALSKIAHIRTAKEAWHILMEMYALGDDNYPEWKTCLAGYLLAQHLWDVVTEPATDPPTQMKKLKEWEERNAAALHIIRISCGEEALSKIEGITKAKDAWCTLEKTYKQKLPRPEPVEGLGSQGESKGEDGPQLPPDEGRVNARKAQRELPPAGSGGSEVASLLPKLRKFVSSGNWEATQHFLYRYPEAIRTTISPRTGTALHVAARSRQVKIVKQLVNLMSEKDLEIQDSYGTTALHWAVGSDNMEMVECMVARNKSLIILPDEGGNDPLSMVCGWGQTTMASHLYRLTQREIFLQYPEFTCQVLTECVKGRTFDIALDLISRYQPSDYGQKSDEILRTYCEILEMLSKCPSLFPSGCELSFWQRWIYSWIKLQPFEFHSVLIDNADQCKTKPTRVTHQDLNIATRLVEVLPKFLGIEQIYRTKSNHIKLFKLMDCLYPYIGRYLSKLQLESPDLRENLTLFMEAMKKQSLNVIADRIFMNAVTFGIVEIILLVSKLVPDIHLTCRDENSRKVYWSSIKYRQEKVLGYFLLVVFQGDQNKVSLDENPFDGETLLHLTGKLSPSSKLSCVSGAALQMQRELQWFSKVESLILPEHRHVPNMDGETAREVFIREHKELRAAGEAWMTSKATSSTVVGALIITIMFTPAFTVPGGINQNIGLPIFLKDKWFKVFVINDAISLFAASTSVLMFLGILTSRYAEEDFLKSLPTKLMVGISSLLLSIATMMVAFCAALIIMLDGQLSMLIPIVSLAAIPIITFMFTQFPLLLEVYKSTYGSSIFEYKKESYSLINEFIEKHAKSQLEEELLELERVGNATI